MKIPYSWLKEYVDITMAPDKLAELLTMSGLTVESIHAMPHDTVFEIEITSNRPDWLSLAGVAREVAAITGKKLKIPKIAHKSRQPKTENRQPTTENRKPKAGNKNVTVRVDDKKLCSRYTARIIRNVRVSESPAWLKQKIEAMGLRPVNNIVDITNFCLFETGEPMHAFDLDKIAGGEVVVRNARGGEKIVSIDGVERVLDASSLVIAGRDKPIAIAGIMGGLATEVGSQTKNLLLEAAYFDPISVRRTARKQALSTESSYRFERKVDRATIILASQRAADLICEIAGGEMGELFDIGEKNQAPLTVSLRCARVSHMLGVEIPIGRIKNILRSLGLTVKSGSKDNITFSIPSFRNDLQNEIDLIEEIARIYGYNNIPQTIPPVIEGRSRRPLTMIVGKKIRDALAGLGFDEIITYSLVSKKSLADTEMPEAEIATVQNPLSSEQEAMRPTLIIGMLNAMRWNINRRNKDLKFFELGEAYRRSGEDSFKEQRSLALGITGQWSAGWVSPSRPFNFFDLKGVIETLCEVLGARTTSFVDTKHGIFSTGECAAIEVGGATVGIIGKVRPSVTSNFDIKDTVFAAEIDCDALLAHSELKKKFKELPRYPSVVRDLSIVVDASLTNAHIVSTTREASGPILKDIQLIDRYIGKQIPAGKVGLTYRCEYQDPKKTLEDKEVSATHSRIIRTLEEKFGARLR